MMYRIRTIIACIIILLGIVHIGFAFPIDVFDPDDLWFIGAGIAIILSGVLNIITVVNCRQRWLTFVTLASNIFMLALFFLARQALQEPQVYIGIYLYMTAILIPIIALIGTTKREDQYNHPPQSNNPDLIEILKETKVVPMLRIFDKKKTYEFYIDWLGFSVDWEHRFEETLPLYMQVSKAGIVLHLTEHHGDCTPGGKVYIECKGLREYHKQLLDKDYRYNRPGLENDNAKTLYMTTIDPFGNKLLFSEKK